MSISFLDTVDLSSIPLKNVVTERLPSAPSSPVVGRRYFDTTLNKEGVYNGSSWDYWITSALVSLSTTAPITTTGGNTPTIAISPASGSNAGSFAASDFTKLAAATSANTASTLVLRDSSGNITIGTATGNLTGTASNASNLNSRPPSDYFSRIYQTGTQLSNTISDFDTQVRTSRLDQIASPVSSLLLGGQKISSLADPVNPQDAATKNYTDTLVLTGTNKGTARVAATSNINVSAPGNTIDSITLSTADILLLTAQTTASQNGLYVFNGAASPLTRTTNATTTAEVTPGLFVYVAEGTVNGSNGFTLVTPAPITLGTTSLVFTQTSGAGQITAGSGLTKSGNILNVIALANSGVIVNADDIAIDTSLVLKKFTQAIGDGTSTTITVTHSLNNARANSTMTQTLTPFNRVFVTEANPTANTMTFTFAVAPTANQYTVQIGG